MDFGNLLFSPNGRIDQQTYWIGVLIIIAANFVAGFIPFLGFIISLGLIYVGVCVYGKRLHDIGKTAWIHALPWAIGFVLGMLAFLFAGGTILTAVMAGGPDGEVNPLSIIAAGGSFFMIMSLSFLVWIGYTIWLGIQKGDLGDNEYGSPPISASIQQGGGDGPVS